MNRLTGSAAVSRLASLSRRIPALVAVILWAALGVSRALAYEEVDLHRISELIGSSLLKSVGDGVRERFVFSNEFELVVDLNVRKPSRPEAMMVHGPGNLIVVWNE